LLSLQQNMWVNPSIFLLHPRPHSEGSRNTSGSPKASALGLGHRPTPDDITASPEPQNRHCPSPPHPRPASNVAPPLARSRPLWCHPRSCVFPTGQARNDRGQITMPSSVTGMRKSRWPLCHPYWHYTHDSCLRSVRNNRSRPLFPWSG
jgi:hypothetical protein